MTQRTWRLLGPDGPYDSTSQGVLGGHRGSGIYGRLDCATAARAIAKGGYVKNRVFFADAADAVTCGYRPCATCLPDDYAAWKARTSVEPQADAAVLAELCVLTLAGHRGTVTADGSVRAEP